MEIEQEIGAFKSEFLRWSIEDARREVRADFPFISRVKDPLARGYLKFMRQLAPAERLTTALAFVTRFDNVPNPPDFASRVDEFCDLARSEAASLSRRKRQNPRVNRKELLTSLADLLDPLYGACEKVPGGVYRYKAALAGWNIVTQLDLGGRAHDLTYCQAVYSPSGQPACDNTSLLRWLGASGQTSWQALEDHEIPDVSRTVRDLCVHLTAAVGEIIKRL